MVLATDLISLEYTPDLTVAGLAYACRSLPYTYDRMGGTRGERLRRIVAGKAVELAFRRYLVSQRIPFDILGSTPFTDPDQYDVSLGGHRCDLKSFQIIHKDKIRQVRNDRSCLLQASALVPADQLNSDRLGNGDIYLFAFLTALIASRREEQLRALKAGQPTFLIHPLTDEWARPENWSPLNPLTIKADVSTPIRLEIGGQLENRSFHSEEILLEPGQAQRITPDYYSLAYFHVDHSPVSRIGIHSPHRRHAYLIHPSQWSNIWVYGMEVIMAGWFTRGEFQRFAHFLPPGTPVFQYGQTKTRNYSLRVSELHPLPELFDRAKKWHRNELL